MLRRLTTWCVLSAFVATLPGAPAFAELVGGQVVKGQAEIERDGNHTHITTRTRETIIDYKGFDIEHDETVRIDQPTARSRILNRVTGSSDASRIEGGLSSNGIVYILNPAGVFIGDRAVLDVSGLVAGAASMSDRDFLKHVDRFEVSGDVSVAEGASIRAAGNVALIGRHVQNLGAVESRKGTIALVAGEDVVLAPLDGNILVRVDGGEPESDAAQPARFGVEQGGELSAQRVVLAAGDHYSLAMNHTGVTRAVREIQAQGGQDGLVQVAGTLDVSNAAAGKQGGRIELRAGKIALLHATLDASGAAGGGEILVGGDVRGSGGQPNADRVVVSADATLEADALDEGDGGKIVIYADERTAFYGQLSARGGANGGDGGFAEISGKQLTSRGKADLGAPQGEAGTLLYDPAKIVIQGGAGNGSDDPATPDSVVGDDGALGQVLAGDEGNGDEPFQIFESEIESTDANIVLEATDRIETAGDFSNQVEGEGADVVLLKRGRSLTLRTTGNVPTDNDATSADLGIDLTTGGNENLEWRVRDGASISLATNLDTSTDPTDAKASIKAGRLVAEGATYLAPEEGASAAKPDPAATRQITLTAERGDVEAAYIQINGENAQQGAGDVPNRIASAGGNVALSSQQGNVTVGAGGIVATGGSASATQNSLGERGGVVQLGTQDGRVTVNGAIDVSGGDGRGVHTVNDGVPFTPATAGGSGGSITIDAKGADGSVDVFADLLTRGGDGRAVNDPTLDDNGVFDGIGGAGGLINVGADVNVTLGALGDRVELNASSGQGSAAGGGVEANAANAAIQVIGARVAAAEGDPEERSVTVHADLIARGGDGGQLIPADPILGLPAAVESETGGAGGRGGDVIVGANTGALHASDMAIDSSGGNGALRLDPLSNRPLTFNGLALVASGAGGTVIARGDDDVEVGSITSRGGDAVNGSAGDDSGTTDGGIVSIVTSSGDVTVDSVDVSGGSASVDGIPEADIGVALNGGDAGSVSIVPTAQDPEQPSNGVGDVTVTGVVGGIGGTGIAKPDDDPETPAQTFGNGARVDVLADRTDGTIRSGDSDARFRGGFVALEGANIGTADVDGRVAVSGSGAANDIAQFTAFESVHGEIADVAGEDLENVQLVMRNEGAEAHLHTAGGVEVLRSVGTIDGDPLSKHTIEKMGRGDDDDPRLAYRLFVVPEDDGNASTPPLPQPELAIDHGAVNLGAAGGEIANDSPPNPSAPSTNRGNIVDSGEGTGAHVTSTGNVRIEGLSIGTDAAPLQFASAEDGDGDPTAALTFDALGSVDAELTGGNARFGAIEIIQSDAVNGDVRIDDLSVAGENEILVVGGGDSGTANESRIVRALTTGSGGNGSGFAYRLDAPNDAALKVDRVELGGDGVLQATGDIVFTNDGAGLDTAAVTAHGNRLTLSGDDISQVGTGPELVMDGDADDPAALIFTGSSFGTAANKIRSTGLKQIAGVATEGDVQLENTGSDLAIQRVVNPNPTDLDLTEIAVAANNLGATKGDVDIKNTGGRILLGKLVEDAEFEREHIVAGGDVRLTAESAPNVQGSIEIDNAHFVKTPVPGVGDVFTAVNDAKISAIGGDIVMNGRIDTEAGAAAHSDEDNAPSDTPVHAKLVLNAPKGTVTLAGDVGARGDADAPLALLDTTSALLTSDREIQVANALFRGTVDGPGRLTVRAADRAHTNPADVATATFGGDIGTGSAIQGLDVEAEKIQFTSADRVVAGAGGVRLTTNQTAIPTVATVSDSGGGLRVQTTGDFEVGDLVDGGDGIHIDKLSSAGPLAIQANTVRVADVNATQLSIDANQITIFARAPGQVKPQGDGPLVTDTGTDLVADSMRFSVVPEIDPLSPGATPRLGLGIGGVKAPGSLNQFDVVRFAKNESGVDRELMIDANGQVLDLMPTGSTLIGNPTQDLERIRPTPEPELQAQPSGEGPAPAPALTAEQVVAYLHCGSATGPSEACSPDDHAPLAAVADWQESAFATPRAGELAADYREMRSGDLSAAFDKAAAGFRAQSGFGEFDSARFAHYLETSPDASEARDAVHAFASLLVGVELLGLSPEQGERARHELAGELAAEADLPGFDADAVLAAVDATPIGMPPNP